MALRQDWSEHPCPIARSLDVIGDPWIVLILREGFTGTRRFDKFRDRIAIADNILSNRLQKMVDAGLLERAVYRGGQRTHHEYVLTEAAHELLPLLHTLAIWGERHTKAPTRSAHMTIRHVDCGAVTTQSETCSNCGAPLSSANTEWKRTWISREPVALASS